MRGSPRASPAPRPAYTATLIVLQKVRLARPAQIILPGLALPPDHRPVDTHSLSNEGPLSLGRGFSDHGPVEAPLDPKRGPGEAECPEPPSSQATTLNGINMSVLPSFCRHGPPAPVSSTPATSRPSFDHPFTTSRRPVIEYKYHSRNPASTPRHG